MNEGFPSQIKEKEKEKAENLLEKKTPQEKPLWVKSSLEVIDRFKKYIKDNLAKFNFNLKLGVALVLAMGAFEVVQGQDMSNFDKAIDGVKSGKRNIENVVDSIYSAHKQTDLNDSTFSYLEYSNWRSSNSPEKVKENTSGVQFSVETLNDTINLGEVEFNNFYVEMNQDLKKYDNGKEDYESKSFSKALSGIKISKENNNIKDSNEKTEIEIGFGKSAKDAIFSALSSISNQKTLVSAMSKKFENVSVSNKSEFTQTELFNLEIVKSNETFYDVKVIVKKISNKDYKNHYKENFVSRKEVREYNRSFSRQDKENRLVYNSRKGNKDYYSAKVIYSR